MGARGRHRGRVAGGGSSPCLVASSTCVLPSRHRWIGGCRRFGGVATWHHLCRSSTRAGSEPQAAERILLAPLQARHRRRPSARLGPTFEEPSEPRQVAAPEREVWNAAPTRLPLTALRSATTRGKARRSACALRALRPLHALLPVLRGRRCHSSTCNPLCSEHWIASAIFSAAWRQQRTEALLLSGPSPTTAVSSNSRGPHDIEGARLCGAEGDVGTLGPPARGRAAPADAGSHRATIRATAMAVRCWVWQPQTRLTRSRPPPYQQTL